MIAEMNQEVKETDRGGGDYRKKEERSYQIIHLVNTQQDCRIRFELFCIVYRKIQKKNKKAH